MPDWLTARPVAHRGLHDASAGVIENTASAFRAAVDANYSIECDVQISVDGEAMVHHDETLGRLTEGDARLDAMTAAELKQVRFRATADRMLTLSELCDLVAARTALLIEIKSRFDGDLRLAQRIAPVLAPYSGHAAVMSFDPTPVAALRRLAPNRPRGLLGQRRDGKTADRYSMPPLRFAVAALSARPNFLGYRVQNLDGVLPRLARAIGLPLLTWTVRTAEDRDRAARLADQMIFEGFRP